MAKQNSKTVQPAAAQPVGRFTYTGTTACGKTATLVHVFRRRYTVAVAGKAMGYITAANHVNAINRLNGNTMQTLKLH